MAVHLRTRARVGHLALALACLLPATMANAQTGGQAAAPPPLPAKPPIERGWITLNVGSGSGSSGFSDTIQKPLYTETETIATTYPGGGGLVASGAVGFRIWKQLSAGVGVSHTSRSDDAAIDASLPHPFFDNQPRQISGTANATHEEMGVDVKIGWTVPLSPRMRLILSGGPSFITVHQGVVTGVKYSESYPYDTAQFATADVTTASKGATGFNAAADVFWLFSRHFGAGGLVQVTHAHVSLSVDGRALPLDAGGVQAGGGLRLVF